MTTTSIAYRKDVALQRHTFGARSDSWLVVATALENAIGASAPEQKKLITAAAKAARRILGVSRARRMAAFHWNGTIESPFDVILLLAYTIEDADALWLADSIAANALRLEPHLPPLQQGRLLSLRCRLLGKLGHTEAADDHNRQVASLARALKSVELHTRAANAFAGRAARRGNYPLASKYRRQEAQLAARTGIKWLQQRSYMGLIADAVRRNDFAAAVTEAWKMMALSEDDPVMHASDMQTLGELLLRMGEPTAARTILTQVVRESVPGRILLPALGGLVLACARTGDLDGVAWVVRQVQGLQAAIANRFLYAQVVLECAEALATIRRADAADWRDRALKLARLHGFHEFVFRAEAIDTTRAPAEKPSHRVYARRVNQILRSVHEMRAANLPARVQLAPASADA